ncbi:MATE family efflux transporter [Merdimmobilis hominis]|uniref:Probable multidrug resistance protein NorM n=2 Tax=Oscillospiraceae TaxID=216572 RepID=A0A6N2V3E7_9FIRM
MCMEENKQVSTPTEAELERERALADPDHPIHHERVTKAIPEGYTSRQLYNDVIQIAWPSCVELLLTQLASMVDLMMVGQLGAWALTSVGLSTQPKFLVMTMFMALNVGATAMVARFKGAGDQENANVILRQALVLSLILSTIAAVVGYIFAPQLIQFMGSTEEATLIGGTQYLRIQMIGIPAVALTSVVTATMRGIGNSRIAMIYNIIANVVNVIFNYLLIGGNLGFPRLEVVGASLATILGQFVAFGIAVYMILRPKSYLRIKRGDSFKFDLPMIKRIVNVGIPAMIEQLLMRAGMIIFSKTVAGLGTVAFATHQVCMNIQALSFMNGQAFATSATSLMGQSLGKKRPDLAQAYCHRARRLGMMVSLFLGVVFFFFGGPIVALYNDDPMIVAEGAKMLMIVAITQPLQSSQFILAGALRGAGDTRATAYITFLTVLVVRPLLAIFLINSMNMGLLGAWVAIAVDQLIRSTLVLFRFNSGKWKKIIV